MYKLMIKAGGGIYRGLYGLYRLGARLYTALEDAVVGKPCVVYVPQERASVGQAKQAAGDFKPTMPASATQPAKAVAKAEEKQEDLVLRPAPPEAGREPPKPSDRVHLMEVRGQQNHQFGVIWFYLFPRERRVKRVFKVLDSELRKHLKGKDRYFMPDADYDPTAGLEAVKAETMKAVKAILGEKAQSARAQRPERERPAPKPAAPAPAVAAAQPTPAPAPREQDKPAEAPHAAVAASHRHVKGESFEGVITVASTTNKPSRDGGSYKTYCLTLNDGEKEVPFFGVEIERSVRDLNLKPGERAKVVFMGKQRVDIPGQEKPSFKNLYQVTRV